MDLATIQKRIEQIEQAQNEAKVLKTTLDDALMEDSKYQELDVQIRDLNEKKKKVKGEVWGQPTYQDAIAKIKDIKIELRDTGDILNHELLEWRQEHDTDEIVVSDGTTRKLKINVRVQPPRGS